MKSKLKNIDKKLFLTTLILFGFGLIMIFSASSVTAYFDDVSPSYYFTRQLIIIILAFIICVMVGMRIKTKSYKAYSWIALVVITCIIFATLIYSVAFQGSKGWINLPLIGTIQPSEFAKPIIIIWISTMLGYSKDKSFLALSIREITMQTNPIFLIILFSLMY